ncbi:hypothetical protein AMK16_00090 [Streptomyces sp. CB00455]|uniref:hypothetical protein n=1 Tax=Streptomyces sp. CB00455 TaxID=1703927 RepID=UPI000965005F|nr:hypothetical protein [Streptomyces sp. CB00455]OKK21750.1 hypothetical protein AMK16_00090 [Streptomyces sp. CB00455]
MSTARPQVRVVCVRTRIAPSLGSGGDRELDDLLDGAALLVREQIACFGGTVTVSIGSVSPVLFGLDGPHEDNSCQAVLAALAALAIRDVLDVPAGSGSGTGGDARLLRLGQRPLQQEIVLAGDAGGRLEEARTDARGPCVVPRGGRACRDGPDGCGMGVGRCPVMFIADGMGDSGGA